jgi:hypothetical protein
MTLTPAELDAFWFAPWSLPVRSACRWLSLAEKARGARPTPAPQRLRPRCLQRRVGQAVAARLAWRQAHPEAALYRSSGASDVADLSIPCWTDKAPGPSEQQPLRAVTEDRLLWGWEVEVERLWRSSETPPSLLGWEVWTQAVLGVGGHLAQLYGELQRGHGARRARSRRAALRA